MDWRTWLPNEKPNLTRAVVIGLGSGVLAGLLRLPLQLVLQNDLPFVTFFPALLAAGLWGGIAAGLICLSLGCALSFAFFLPRADITHVAWAFFAFLMSGGLLLLAGSAVASAIRELRESQRRMEAAEAQMKTLIGELAHRSRNGLTVIMSIISQSARSAKTADELTEVVNARLGAMAHAQDAVVQGGGDTAGLASLLERTLTPFDLGRFSFQPSPELQVVRDTATALALLTHELATNAVKHGALASPDGRVEVGWNTTGGSVRMLWRERGGPPAPKSNGRGFGTRLLDSALAPHGGRAERRFEPDGMVCEIDFPHAAPS